MLADGQSKILMETGNCIIIEVSIIVSERLRRKVVLLLCRAVNSAVHCQLETDVYSIEKVKLILKLDVLHYIIYKHMYLYYFASN